MGDIVSATRQVAMNLLFWTLSLAVASLIPTSASSSPRTGNQFVLLQVRTQVSVKLLDLPRSNETLTALSTRWMVEISELFIGVKDDHGRTSSEVLEEQDLKIKWNTTFFDSNDVYGTVNGWSEYSLLLPLENSSTTSTRMRPILVILWEKSSVNVMARRFLAQKLVHLPRRSPDAFGLDTLWKPQTEVDFQVESSISSDEIFGSNKDHLHSGKQSSGRFWRRLFVIVFLVALGVVCHTNKPPGNQDPYLETAGVCSVPETSPAEDVQVEEEEPYLSPRFVLLRKTKSEESSDDDELVRPPALDRRSIGAALREGIPFEDAIDRMGTLYEHMGEQHNQEQVAPLSFSPATIHAHQQSKGNPTSLDSNPANHSTKQQYQTSLERTLKIRKLQPGSGGRLNLERHVNCDYHPASGDNALDQLKPNQQTKESPTPLYLVRTHVDLDDHPTLNGCLEHHRPIRLSDRHRNSIDSTLTSHEAELQEHSSMVGDSVSNYHVESRVHHHPDRPLCCLSQAVMNDERDVEDHPTDINCALGKEKVEHYTYGHTYLAETLADAPTHQELPISAKSPLDSNKSEKLTDEHPASPAQTSADGRNDQEHTISANSLLDNDKSEQSIDEHPTSLAETPADSRKYQEHPISTKIPLDSDKSAKPTDEHLTYLAETPADGRTDQEHPISANSPLDSDKSEKLIDEHLTYLAETSADGPTDQEHPISANSSLDSDKSEQPTDEHPANPAQTSADGRKDQEHPISANSLLYRDKSEQPIDDHPPSLTQAPADGRTDRENPISFNSPLHSDKSEQPIDDHPPSLTQALTDGRTDQENPTTANSPLHSDTSEQPIGEHPAVLTQAPVDGRTDQEHPITANSSLDSDKSEQPTDKHPTSLAQVHKDGQIDQANSSLVSTKPKHHIHEHPACLAQVPADGQEHNALANSPLDSTKPKHFSHEHPTCLAHGPTDGQTWQEHPTFANCPLRNDKPGHTIHRRSSSLALTMTNDQTEQEDQVGSAHGDDNPQHHTFDHSTGIAQTHTNHRTDHLTPPNSSLGDSKPEQNSEGHPTCLVELLKKQKVDQGDHSIYASSVLGNEQMQHIDGHDSYVALAHPNDHALSADCTFLSESPQHKIDGHLLCTTQALTRKPLDVLPTRTITQSEPDHINNKKRVTQRCDDFNAEDESADTDAARVLEVNEQEVEPGKDRGEEDEIEQVTSKSLAADRPIGRQRTVSMDGDNGPPEATNSQGEERVEANDPPVPKFTTNLPLVQKALGSNTYADQMMDSSATLRTAASDDILPDFVPSVALQNASVAVRDISFEFDGDGTRGRPFSLREIRTNITQTEPVPKNHRRKRHRSREIGVTRSKSAVRNLVSPTPLLNFSKHDDEAVKRHSPTRQNDSPDDSQSLLEKPVALRTAPCDDVLPDFVPSVALDNASQAVKDVSLEFRGDGSKGRPFSLKDLHSHTKKAEPKLCDNHSKKRPRSTVKRRQETRSKNGKVVVANLVSPTPRLNKSTQDHRKAKPYNTKKRRIPFDGYNALANAEKRAKTATTVSSATTTGTTAEDVDKDSLDFTSDSEDIPVKRGWLR